MPSGYQYRNWRGTEGPAGKNKRRPQRNFVVLARDFTSVEQAVPLRLVYGRARVAGVQITPIYAFQSEETESELSGKGAGK
jgi:hypothetical protein